VPTGKPLSTLYVQNPTENLQVANKQYVDDSPSPTFARVVKKVDETVTNSTTLQDDDELFVPLNANKTYGFFLLLFINSAAAADYKGNFSIPAGASGTRSVSAPSIVPSATVGITAEFTPATDGQIQCIMIHGRVITAGTAGNLQYRFAQDTSNAGTTRDLQGSHLVVWQEID